MKTLCKSFRLKLFVECPFPKLWKFSKDTLVWCCSRSSHRRCSVKKDVLKRFANFTKHPCWSLFLIKLHAFRPATLLKRDSNTGVLLWILWNFEENLRTAASVARMSILTCVTFCISQWVANALILSSNVFTQVVINVIPHRTLQNIYVHLKFAAKL